MGQTTERESLRYARLNYIEQADRPLYIPPVSLGASGLTIPSTPLAYAESNLVDVGSFSKHRLMMDIVGPGSGASILWYLSARTYSDEDDFLGSVNLFQNYGKMYSGIIHQFAWTPGVNNGFPTAGISYTLCGGAGQLLVGAPKFRFRLTTMQSPEHGTWYFNLHYLGERR